MPPSFPPLAALFLTHFHDLTGQEVAYYVSVDNDALPPGIIEHASLPSGMHLRSDDLVTFVHAGLPAAAVFRSREREGGRGRRMGTLGVVLAPPSQPDALFDLAPLLEALYDRLEGIDDPFAHDGPSAGATRALLDDVWARNRAEGGIGAQPVQSARTVAVRLAGPLRPSHPVTYLSALLATLGPALITVYKAVLSGQRILLYAQPPLLPLEAYAWCIWAMGLPPASATTAGARALVWLGQVGLMQLDEVKARPGGWVATTSDLVYKSHTDAYDLLVDFSESLSVVVGDDDTDVRAPRDRPPPTPTLYATASADGSTAAGRSGKPAAAVVTYAFRDLALYRSLVLLDQSPPSVRAETVGFSATSRTGGLWLVVFEMLERLWRLCVGVCEFATGRGRVGASSGPIALGDGDEDAHLLRAELDLDGDGDAELAHLAQLEQLEDPGASTDEGAAEPALPDEAARRGRLILDQLHHNAHHLYADLVRTAAGSWELSDAHLRSLAGASRIGWGGRGSPDARFWLALARTWNVEPAVDAPGAGAGGGAARGGLAAAAGGGAAPADM